MVGDEQRRARFGASVSVRGEDKQRRTRFGAREGALDTRMRASFWALSKWEVGGGGAWTR